jgi:transcriptional antiterminator RfaH
MKNWYLVYTKPRQERVAADNLERQGFETYVPWYRQVRRRAGRRAACIEPLFPRYLFIRLDTSGENWSPIRSTIGVTSLVRFGMEPAVVPLDLVTLLRSREGDDGLHRLPCRDFRAGDRVRLREGPLEGYQAIFLARNGEERVVVLMDIVGKRTRVVANAADLEPAY